MMPDKITFTERQAFDMHYNLADAQVYVQLDDKLRGVMHNLSGLAEQAYATGIEELKASFLETYCGFYDLPIRNDAVRTLFCYSATIALEITANVIRTADRFARKNIALLHPTFDATYYICQRHDLHIFSVSQTALKDSGELRGILEQANIEALFLTVPNNPTGEVLSREELQAVCDICKSLDILLVVDACFRFYWNHQVFDHYAILIDSGVEYIVIEDTGKLFNVLDIKVGVMRYRTTVDKAIEDIHLDFVLNVPRLSLVVLRELLANASDYRQRIFADLTQRRQQLAQAASGMGCQIISQPYVPVALAQFTHDIDDKRLEKHLQRQSVAVLSARGYYWHDPAQGKNKLRIALLRETDYFTNGLARLSQALQDYEEGVTRGNSR